MSESIKQETIADIVREMRKLGKLDEKSTDKIPRSLMGLGLRTYAGRIEEAWKREKSQSWHHREMEELILRHEKEVAELKNQIGNAAAMRAALVKTSQFLSKLGEWLKVNDEGQEYALADGVIHTLVEHALASPPKNYDRFADYQSALNCFALVECHSDFTMGKFARWLFATAEERKGGNDGE